MKASTKITWFKEIAKWLRRLGDAEGWYVTLLWGGNALLRLTGMPPVLAATHDDATPTLLKVAVAGFVYVMFNAAATRLEIKAANVERETPLIILPSHFGSRGNDRSDSS